jgi:DNA-binding XRE family transcriptional regulator
VYESATLEEIEVELPSQYKDFPSELEDINSVGINYTGLTTPELKEDTFGQRLRKSRVELGLTIRDVADICDVTPSVVDGYELARYYPSKEVLDKLSSTFDINYLCRDGYTNLILNYDKFLEKLNIWIAENNLTRKDAATKLEVSPALIKYWFKGGVMRIYLYNKIRDNLDHYSLL